jgi:hypothetical protein
MLPTDYVSKACVVEDKTCKISDKCAECKREIVSLAEIDKILKNGAACKIASGSQVKYDTTIR